MDYQSIITFFMEMAGTVAFAASGAMVGVERNMDIFGVSVLGVVTAVGGGMIRDIVLGIIPPNVFTNPVYALGGYHYFLCGFSGFLLETAAFGRAYAAYL